MTKEGQILFLKKERDNFAKEYDFFSKHVPEGDVDGHALLKYDQKWLECLDSAIKAMEGN